MKAVRVIFLLPNLFAFLMLLPALALPVAAQVAFFNPPALPSDLGSPLFTGDFNGDSKLDIISSSGVLALGNGDGTFTTGKLIEGGALAVGDFNGDGKLDVLQQGTGTLRVLLGNGDGTFQPPVSTNTGAGMLQTVAVSDLRGDGKYDVIAIYNNALLLFLGNGNGTFSPPSSYAAGSTSYGGEITLGDFNGDGKPDVVLSLSGFAVPGEQVVFLGNGDGTFQAGKVSTGFYNPGSVVAGDFNSDGKLDLIVSDAGINNGTTGVGTWLLLGNGDGTFQPTTMLFANPGTLAVADLNADGKLDLVEGDFILQVYLGHGDGTFSSPLGYNFSAGNVNSATGGYAVADFNGDGKLDIAAGAVLLLGNGNGSFQGQPAVALLNSPLEALTGGAVLGDFDKNGTLDVALSGGYILLNDGTGVLTLAHSYALQYSTSALNSIAAADLNSDGNLDLVIAGGSASDDAAYSILLGSGDGSFKPPVLYQLGAGDANEVVVADFNNDHKLDLAMIEEQNGQQSIAVTLGNGDGTFGPATYWFDAGGTGLAAGDFNGDGNVDLVASGTAGLAILFGNGDGTFQPASLPLTNSLGSVILTADLNVDGKLDLVAGSVFLGNGDGTFKQVSPAPSIGALSLADVNGDGKLDLVGSGNTGGCGSAGVALGNGNGTFDSFISAYNFPAISPGCTYGVFELAGDMNGDGKPDFVLGTNTGTVFVALNTTKPKFSIAASVPSPATVPAGSSSTSTITVDSGSGLGAVTLSCSSVTLNGNAAGPAPPACSFSPASIANGAGTSTLTISTTGSSAALSHPATRRSGLLFAMALLPIAGMVLAGLGVGSTRKKKRVSILLLTMCGLVFLGACGGSGSGSGGGSGTPSGTYTITVTGMSGAIVSSTVVSVTVQ